MGGLVQRLKQWWDTATNVQKLITLGGIVLVLLMLVGTYSIASRPKYVMLYSGLPELEQGEMVTAIEEMGVEPHYETKGTIEVPESKVRQVRMALAKAGKTPKSSQPWTLNDLKDNPIAAPPAIERERLKAIAEGEISKTIETMEGVQSSRVHITMPSQSVFAEEQKPPTCSITIIQGNQPMPLNAGRAMALVARGAVEGLDTANVVVLNQRGDSLFNGSEDDTAGPGGGTKKIAVDEEVSRKWQRELQSALDTAFGPGSTIVSVHADVDLDPSKTDSRMRTPSKKPLVQEKAGEDMSSGANGANPAVGAAGLAGNTPGTAPADAMGKPGPGEYKNQSEATTFLVNEVNSTTTKVGGTIKGLAINVIADSNRIKDEVGLNRILEGATQQFGTDQKFTKQYTLVAFDKKASMDAKVVEEDAKSQARMQQILSVLPVAALLLVAMMVMKQVGKFAKTQLPAEPAALEMSAADSAFSSAEMQQALGGGGTQELLAIIEGAHPKGAGSSLAIPVEEEEVEVGDIKDRVHLPLEQLKKMADERPTVVAMLIKSMLLEDRR